MNNIGKYLKRKMAMISFAMGGVEKNMLSQTGESLENNIGQEQRNTQGTVVDDLKQGKITQEVENLRWRTYKILQASEGLVSEITGYDDDGMPIVNTKKVDKKKQLKKATQDPFDTYPLELIVDNSAIAASSSEAIDNDNIKLFDKAIINKTTGPKDTDGEPGAIEWSATHGSINGTEYFASNKAERPILISRDSIVNFDIESFTEKLHIRKINETERLLEFYVNKYPDEYNRTSRLFLSEIKKIIEYNKSSLMLEFLSVGFVTYKTLGADDFLQYDYKMISFDKIVEFKGHYIVKFIGEVILDGKNILDVHRVDALDDKYINKVKK